jgi:hypothetical protein
MSADRRDFLDEIVDERRERNPEFPDLVQAALEGRVGIPNVGWPNRGRLPNESPASRVHRKSPVTRAFSVAGL